MHYFPVSNSRKSQIDVRKEKKRMKSMNTQNLAKTNIFNYSQRLSSRTFPWGIDFFYSNDV